VYKEQTTIKKNNGAKQIKIDGQFPISYTKKPRRKKTIVHLRSIDLFAGAEVDGQTEPKFNGRLLSKW